MSTARSDRRSRSRLALAGATVVVVAVVAQVLAPTGADPVAEVVPVVATDLICPDVRNASGIRTEVSGVTPKPLTVASTGRAVLGTVTKPSSVATLADGAYAVIRTPTQDDGPVIGAAISGRAPGFAMDQLAVSRRSSDHGLAGVTCTEPTNDAWFVGPGSDVGRSARLYLTDIEATPARVDITFYGKNGRIEAPAGLGVEIGANSRRVVALDQLAPGAGVLAVRVRATAGRIGAAVLDTEVSGLSPRGADWVPTAEAPGTRVVVPGLVAGAGIRRLVLFAPGEGLATVKVKLIGKEGTFAPVGADTVEIDRGKVTSVNLGTATVSDDTAVLVQSDTPVVAGVRWTIGSGVARDYAFSAGVAALTGPAVMAGNRTASGYNTSLLLSAPDGAGEASVQPLKNGIPSGMPVVVKVGAGRSTRIAMPNGGYAGSFQVVITPKAGGGPLYGGVVRALRVDSAVGITISPVRDARIDAAAPAARPDADVGLTR